MRQDSFRYLRRKSALTACSRAGNPNPPSDPTQEHQRRPQWQRCGRLSQTIVQGAIAPLTAAIGLGVITSAGAIFPSAVLAQTNPHVTYLNRLADCQTATSPSVPLPVVTGFTASSRITGWVEGRCVIETTVARTDNPDQRGLLAICRYTPATLTLLTSDRAFEAARVGRYDFNPSDPQDAALADAMARECQFFQDWFNELSRGTMPPANRRAVL